MVDRTDFHVEDNVITRAEAEHFANEWIAAWNSHELARILAHYSDDFTMASPRIATVAKEHSGVLVGKQAVGAYWQKALALVPTLQVKLQNAFVGADSVAIHYESVRGPALEVFFFNESGLVSHAAAHYIWPIQSHQTPRSDESS